MDFDPRDYDSRNDERHGNDRERGSRGGSDDDRDWDNWRQPEIAGRERDDDTRELGRGPGDDSRQADSDKHGQDARDYAREDARWPERDRGFDPREVFTRHLNLPRGLERELVRDRDREYTLRGSESRTLATVGAFLRTLPRCPPPSTSLNLHSERLSSGLVQGIFCPPSRRAIIDVDPGLRAPRRRPKNALPSKNALPYAARGITGTKAPVASWRTASTSESFN